MAVKKVPKWAVWYFYTALGVYALDPWGIDLAVVDDFGNLVALPRSVATRRINLEIYGIGE